MSEVRLAEIRDAAGTVSRETFDRLLTFEETFRRWSRKINLVAPSTEEALWRRHLLDSAQLLRLAPEAGAWLDLGSGGGFPGAVLAILLRERDGASIQMIEANHRKCAFLRTALAEAGAKAEIITARIEAARGVRQPQIVTARALAPLPELLRLAAPWLTTGARALFHKGRDYQGEIELARDAWSFDLVIHPSIVDTDGVVLEISSLRPGRAI